jgi:hypothetical protein
MTFKMGYHTHFIYTLLLSSSLAFVWLSVARDKLFEETDVDNDGSVSLLELTTAMRNLLGGSNPSVDYAIKAAFMFSKDKVESKKKNSAFQVEKPEVHFSRH